MVSWTYAFKRGFIIWLWSIVWGIVGGIVALVLSGGSLLVLITNPSAYTNAGSWVAAFVGMFLGILIGALIATIGNYAAIVKIVLESVEETKSPPQPPT